MSDDDIFALVVLAPVAVSAIAVVSMVIALVFCL